MMQNEKPKLLYHGTCWPIGEALEPRFNSGDINGRFKDGPRALIFAADDVRQAKIFAFNIAPSNPAQQQNKPASDKYLTESGYFGDIWMAAFMNREGLEKELKHTTPTLYTLDSSSFTQNMNINNGRPTGELVSSEAVKPNNRQAVTMEDVLKDGTQVFFIGHPHITKDVWYRVKRRHVNFEQGEGPLNYYAELQREGLIVHENERLGINPVNLDNHYKPGRYDEAIKSLKTEMVYERTRQAVCEYAYGDPCVNPVSVAANKKSAKGL